MDLQRVTVNRLRFFCDGGGDKKSPYSAAPPPVDSLESPSPSSRNCQLGMKSSCRIKPETNSTRGGADKYDHGDVWTAVTIENNIAAAVRHNIYSITEARRTPQRRKKVKPAYSCMHMYVNTYFDVQRTYKYTEFVRYVMQTTFNRGRVDAYEEKAVYVLPL